MLCEFGLLILLGRVFQFAHILAQLVSVPSLFPVSFSPVLKSLCVLVESLLLTSCFTLLISCLLHVVFSFSSSPMIGCFVYACVWFPPIRASVPWLVCHVCIKSAVFALSYCYPCMRVLPGLCLLFLSDFNCGFVMGFPPVKVQFCLLFLPPESSFGSLSHNSDSKPFCAPSVKAKKKKDIFSKT